MRKRIKEFEAQDETGGYDPYCKLDAIKDSLHPQPRDFVGYEKQWRRFATELEEAAAAIQNMLEHDVSKAQVDRFLAFERTHIPEGETDEDRLQNLSNWQLD